MTTNKGEYVPSAKSAVKSTVFGFGEVGAGNTTTSIATAKGTVPEVDAVHDDSSHPVFDSGGTQNYFGNVITLGHLTKINNIANTAAQIA
jgi:hypothetical protein